jgi:hypothetical protein
VATIFFSLASKLVGTVFFSLTSKLVGTVYPGLASKLVVGFLVEPQNQCGGGFFRFGPQNWKIQFGNLGLKITATVFWFGSQNQVCFSLSVAS